MTDHNCATCRHSLQAGVREGKPALVCRRYPPQLSFIIVPRQMPPEMVLRGAQPNQLVPSEEQRSGFPAVMPEWCCGEFAGPLSS